MYRPPIEILSPLYWQQGEQFIETRSINYRTYIANIYYQHIIEIPPNMDRQIGHNVSIIYRTSIEYVSSIYRQTIQQRSNTNQQFVQSLTYIVIEQISSIYRQIRGNLSKLDRTCI